jgi:hypothetical protein
MLQDLHNHAHPLPLANTGLNTTCPHARRVPDPVISPSTLSQKSSAHAPPQTAAKSLLVLVRVCRFLAAAANLPCLLPASCILASRRRFDLPAVTITPVWLMSAGALCADAAAAPAGCYHPTYFAPIRVS